MLINETNMFTGESKVCTVSDSSSGLGAAFRAEGLAQRPKRDTELTVWLNVPHHSIEDG